MKNLIQSMIKIHVSKGGDKIYVGKYKDHYTLKKSLVFIIVMKNGEYSELKHHSILKLQPEDLSYFKEFGMDIDESDVQAISKFLIKKIDEIKYIEAKDTISLKELFRKVHEYCEENELEGDDGHYYILTKDFDSLIRAYGHKPLEIKKIMKMNNMLKVQRMYDFNKKIPDEKGNCTVNAWHIAICKSALIEEIKDEEVEQ